MNFLPFLLVLISVPKTCPQTWGYSHHHEMSYFGADVAQCHLNRKGKKKKKGAPTLYANKAKGQLQWLRFDLRSHGESTWHMRERERERPAIKGLFPCHCNAASSSFTIQPPENRQTTVFKWKLLKSFHKAIAEVEAESQPAGPCRKHSEFLEIQFQFSVSFLKSHLSFSLVLPRHYHYIYPIIAGQINVD